MKQYLVGGTGRCGCISSSLSDSVSESEPARKKRDILKPLSELSEKRKYICFISF